MTHISLCCCSVADLSARSGLAPTALLDLVAKYPALATLDTAGRV